MEGPPSPFLGNSCLPESLDTVIRAWVDYHDHPFTAVRSAMDVDRIVRGDHDARARTIIQNTSVKASQRITRISEPGG